MIIDDFPDSRIGASLKPTFSALTDAPKPNFPDSRIGASLKPLCEAPAGAYRRYFPDSRIGASLKRSARDGLGGGLEVT